MRQRKAKMLPIARVWALKLGGSGGVFNSELISFGEASREKVETSKISGRSAAMVGSSVMLRRG